MKLIVSSVPGTRSCLYGSMLIQRDRQFPGIRKLACENWKVKCRHYTAKWSHNPSRNQHYFPPVIHITDALNKPFISWLVLSRLSPWLKTFTCRILKTARKGTIFVNNTSKSILIQNFRLGYHTIKFLIKSSQDRIWKSFKFSQILGKAFDNYCIDCKQLNINHYSATWHSIIPATEKTL